MKLEDKYEMPDFIQSASLEIKGLWLEKIKLKQELDQHPKRFLTVTNTNGEEVIVDCKGAYPWMKKHILEHCNLTDASEEFKEYVESQLVEAKERKRNFQSNYISKITVLTKRLNNSLSVSGDIGVLDLKETDLIELLGKFYTVEEVHKHLNTKWGVILPMPTLKKWVKKHQDTIDKKKAEYVIKNKDFRIATETGRLEILNNQLGYYQDLFEKRGAESTTRIIVSLLEQARKEVKGDQLSLTIDGKIDINATLQGATNIVEISRKLPINMLIVGLTAAKQGLNPLSLMTSLATSYYKNYNGFGGEILDSDIQSPTHLIKNYNFSELEKKNKEYNQKMRANPDLFDQQHITDAEVITDKKKELLESLKNLRKQVNK